MNDQLSVPNVPNWQDLYASGARARCMRDDPPMRGFGRSLKKGDVVNVHSVCWSGLDYEIAVKEEYAFYTLEGYFEPCATELNPR